MPEKMHLVTTSAEATRDLGRRIGRQIDQGMVIALDGDLGAGKTVWVQGLARGLDVPASYAVTSPSYTLVNEYPGRVPLYHVDLYRLEGLSDMEEIGLYEILDGDGVVAIEWARGLVGPLPEGHLRVRLGMIADTHRKIHLSAYGRAADNLIKRLGYSAG